MILIYINRLHGGESDLACCVLECLFIGGDNKLTLDPYIESGQRVMF